MEEKKNVQNPPAILMENITKKFGGVLALDNVTLEVAEGEIRGLVGENGAGKSTLMKILSGVHTEYEGRVSINGRPVAFSSTADSLEHGIGMVYQELSVVGSLTVAENTFLGKQPVTNLGTVSWKTMQSQARKHLQSLGIQLNVNLPLSLVPFSVRQMIEIARVVFSGARIIILDEPTSSLSHTETQRLFELIRRVKERGNTVIFISHFIEDVMAISDSITILKDGRVVDTLKNVNLVKHDVIQKMIGKTKRHLVREADEVVQLRSPRQEKVLEVKNLTRSLKFEDVTFSLVRGEILGLFGPLGAGQQAVGKSIFGLEGYDKGTILLEGKPLPKQVPHRVRDMGVAYISEDRKSSLFHQFELFKNITLPFLARILGPRFNWVIKEKKEREVTRDQIRAFSIKTSSPDAPLGSLSGGNQQKVAIARWLTVFPKVIIFQEPTRGVDVGAKAEIVKSIRDLKDQGISCIVISMEPETILDLSDRVLIFSHGSVVKELKETTTSKVKMMELI
ncbi:MAG: sugar ABC transporter ATP-binding protein [Spirochaetota bacterium]